VEDWDWGAQHLLATRGNPCLALAAGLEPIISQGKEGEGGAAPELTCHFAGAGGLAEDAGSNSMPLDIDNMLVSVVDAAAA